MEGTLFISYLRDAKQRKDQMKEAFAISNLRKEILRFLVNRESEDEFYDFFKKSDFEKELIPKICAELETAGWKWKLGFGDTALFIYEEEVPATCWG